MTTGSGVDAFSLYKKYYIDRDYEQVDLFRLLKDSFGIRRVIYPGSYIQISPSFIFPEVVYIDADIKAIRCFQSGQLLEIIHDRKEYSEDPMVTFHGADYGMLIPIYQAGFDLLISQYAGFISQECKKYLKIGGLLVANNSHGDAQLANMDPTYELIGVINYRNNKFYYSTKNLENYFISKKKGLKISIEYLKSINHGIGFKITANHYLFIRRK